ncbi:MAG: insulinase family protein [Bacteroidales bacterium]|nr:insulinase family protein [Bacteroidales bacterium]
MSYLKKILDNGMKVILHRDDTTPLVTVNLLYQVGSRNERADRTGFAHLFEHLMFGGTKRFPDYDLEVDAMGGESNAFTNNDYTNYYLTIPAQHLEQALTLEADRMRGEWDIADNHWNVLDVQQKVVTEEYNQRYMNQPYGDVWMLLRPLCYKTHPYRWCTIGADIKHVQEATLDDVRNFFNQYYKPNNAILAIAGNIDEQAAFAMVERLFGDIRPDNEKPTTALPKEQEQTEARRLEVERDVPNNAIYKAWRMCDHQSADYYVYDMISDILSNGHSSRMYQHLVQEQQLFTEINAYITGELDEGLFVVSGRLCDNTTFEQAELAIDEEIERLQHELVSAHEVEKVANKYENTFVYSQYKAADRALGLCFYEMLGDIDLVNTEPEIYRKVTPEQVMRVAQQLTHPRSSTLIIRKK